MTGPRYSSIEPLVEALEAAGASVELLEQARAGAFDDCASSSATPKVDLVRRLEAEGLLELVDRVVAGDFDATREDWLAFFNTPEGFAVAALYTASAKE
jgi:hypothetical protein